MKYFYISIISILILCSCKELQPILVTNVDSFVMNKINMDGIEAEIKLNIKNPNKSGFSIYPSQFDVLYSGIALGKAKLNKRVHINGNSEKIYTFKLNSNFSDLNPLDALQLLNGGKSGNIEIKGDLKAGKLFIKKRFPILYSDKINMFK